MMPRLLLLCALLLAWAPRASDGAVSFNLVGSGFNNAGQLWFAGSAAYHNGLTEVDGCGVCAGDNSTCAGCDGVPNSGKFLDACGRCACSPGSADPACVPQAACPDCAGTPGGTKDTRGACGGCREPTDPLYGTAGVPNYAVGGCVGCDGVANSGAVPDACGVCRQPGDVAANSTCTGCDGVANSGAVFDACCVCQGNATTASACYRALVNPQFAGAAYNPNNRTAPYAAFFTAAGKALYDACGECAAWGYAGAECSGCDGVAMSGALLDPCGVCNGTCACAAGVAAAAGSCGPGVSNATQCALLQTAGPGSGRTPLYPSTPLNRPGVPAWMNVTSATCGPAGAAPVQAAGEWIVQLYGTEFGPFTLAQLRTGAIDVFDSVTSATVSVALTPTTLVGRVAIAAVQRNISYGYTSALTYRAAAWSVAALGRPGVTAAPSTINTPNMVTLVVNQTAIINFTDSRGQPTLRFLPVGRVPDLIGVAYPSCTGSSYRHGKHRTHGKRTGLHHLGLIVSVNLSEGIPDISTSLGVSNQSWNPLSEFIFDVVERWEDQTCVCHEEWTYSPEATPPTCKRAWGAFGSWLADTHPEPADPGAPFSLSLSRSLAGTTVRPSGGPRGEGGFYVQDAGGISLRAFGSDITSEYGSDTTRGPWRVSADGTLTFSTVGPLPNAAGVCKPTARLVPPAPGSRGAVWRPLSMAVNQGFTTMFRFVLSAPAQRCNDVRTLSRSYSEEIRTRSYTACATQAADGFAFVLYDPLAMNASVVGAGGGGLGYAGLPNSVAVEFDTMGDPSLDEPAVAHVAVLSRGALPNDPSHQYRLGVATDVPAFTDGKEHTVRVNYTTPLSLDALVAALNTPSWRGGGDNMAALLAGGAGAGVGLLQVYMDDMTTPVLTVPLSAASFLRPGGSGKVFFGLSASTGAVWQAVDIISWNVTAY